MSVSSNSQPFRKTTRNGIIGQSIVAVLLFPIPGGVYAGAVLALLGVVLVVAQEDLRRQRELLFIVLLTLTVMIVLAWRVTLFA